MAARIAGISLPNKRIEVALTYIYGIGHSLAREILESVKIDFDTRADDLTEAQLQKIRTVVEKYQIEGDLRQQISLHIKRLQEINSYRGYRHRRKLPVRGQRTKTNARTRKGRTKMAIAKKKTA